MFIHLLNRTEKEILIDLLMRLANIDNTFDRNEMDYVLAIHLKHEVDMKTDPSRSVQQLCSSIKKDPSRVIILQEMLRLARIDGEFAEPERVLIDEVAKYFKITAEKFIEIDRWVKSGLTWSANGTQIITSLNTVKLRRF